MRLRGSEALRIGEELRILLGLENSVLPSLMQRCAAVKTTERSTKAKIQKMRLKDYDMDHRSTQHGVQMEQN